MIPVKLDIKGLYSYLHPVSVDFTTLTSSGLFGIFGPVGSGKSTLLEAMMFVLFDRTTRLNKTEDRYYNMMNLQSNEMLIDFIFRAGTNNQHKYRFYFKARRSPKYFSKINVKDRSYYHWVNQEWVPLDHPQVLGMTYENFMQTVIIPQGKFRQFIDLKPTARTQMIKELFQLDRYDLAPPTQALLMDTRDKITYLEGQISTYGDLGPDHLKKLRDDIKRIKKKMESDHRKLQQADDQLKSWDELKRLVDELESVGNQLAIFKAEESFYGQKERQLNNFEKANRIFRSKIEIQQEYLTALKAKQADLEALLSSLKEHKSQEHDLSKGLNLAKGSIDQISDWELEIDELKLLEQYLELQEKLSHLSTGHREHQEILESSLQEKKQLDKETEQLNYEMQTLLGADESYQQWLIRARWWERLEYLQQQLADSNREWEELNQEILNLTSQKKKLISASNGEASLVENIDILQTRFRELSIRQDWHQHAQNLEDGKPCPLCGSTHHPDIMDSGQVEAEIRQTKDKLDELTSKKSALETTLRQKDVVAAEIKERARRGNQLKIRMSELNQQIKDHRDLENSNKYGEHRPEDLHQILDREKRAAEKLRKLRESLSSLHHKSQILSQQIADKRNDIQGMAAKKEQVKGALDQLAKHFQLVHPHEYQDLPKDHHYQKIEKLTAKIQQSRANYHNLQQQYESLSRSTLQLESKKRSLEDQIQDLSSKSEQLEGDLKTLCKRESFHSISQVQKILGMRLDPVVERKEILAYQRKLMGLKSTHQDLLAKKGKKKYDEVRHLEIQSAFEQTKEQMESNRKALGGNEHSLREKEHHLDQKLNLQKQLEILDSRLAQLREISQLLRGNGFINYISSTYLQNLCKMANDRFSKLTGNRLRLELNEQNEFLVRDFLNEGRTRLLKTLSGGQIFQASLCLALALAENVRSLNQADQSFFFLDEGFGSLDKASLRVVFDTLKSLQKENRIVGIISHVEELQQEIDIYLQIVQKGESGSMITCSWQESGNFTDTY